MLQRILTGGTLKLAINTL